MSSKSIAGISRWGITATVLVLSIVPIMTRATPPDSEAMTRATWVGEHGTEITTRCNSGFECSIRIRRLGHIYNLSVDDLRSIQPIIGSPIGVILTGAPGPEDWVVEVEYFCPGGLLPKYPGIRCFAEINFLGAKITHIDRIGNYFEKYVNLDGDRCTSEHPCTWPIQGARPKPRSK